MNINASVFSLIMLLRCIYVLLSLVAAQAAFDGIRCESPAAVLPDRIRMTPSKAGIVESRCDWSQQPFAVPNVTFIQFDRTYAARRTSRKDSILGIAFYDTDSNEKIFDVDIHNNRITSEQHKCMGVFAHTKSKPMWLRVSLEPLVDLDTTFVIVDYAGHKASQFRNCFRMELRQHVNRTHLKLRASSHSGLQQDIVAVKFTEPRLYRKQGVNVDTLKQLERRVAELEKTVMDLSHDSFRMESRVRQGQRMFTESHDTFSKKMESHSDMTNAKITSRFIVMLAFVVIVFACMAVYVRNCQKHITIIKDHLI